MSPSVHVNLHSGILSDKDVTGKIPPNYGSPIRYAKAREIKMEEGILLRQYYSNYLFFIEQFEFQLEKELKVSYVVKEPSFFLFFMLEGSVSFAASDGAWIADIVKGMFYASYNREGYYFVNNLTSGTYRFFYITPRTEWLERKIPEFPALKDFIINFNAGQQQYAHMVRCMIDGKTQRAILKLFGFRLIKGIDIEAQILDQIIKIFKLYNNMVASGNYLHSDSQKDRIRIIRKYIDENAKDLKIGDIQKIAEKFLFARRTLTRLFKEETGFTVLEYIEKSKLEHALNLLKFTKLSIKEISVLSGYHDQNYFSRVFRKQYGISPRKVR